MPVSSEDTISPLPKEAPPPLPLPSLDCSGLFFAVKKSNPPCSPICDEMVKVEDLDEDSAVDNLQPARVQAGVKAEEEGQPSSSSSFLRSEFIGMGFSPMLVDRVLRKHGDSGSDTILESLLSRSALQNSGSESSSSLGSLFDSDNEENSSRLEPRIEANQDVKPEPDSFSERRLYLLSTMNFSHQEVDLAFSQLGEEAPLDELVDCIVTAQVAGFSGGKENGDATNEGKAESLFGVMDKTLHLLRMGFTEVEVSAAIDSFGQETTLQELADSIFARRIASTIEQKEVKIESDFVGEAETKYSTYHQTLNYYDDDNDSIRVKKAKHVFTDDRGACSSRTYNQPSLTPWFSGCGESVSNGSLKEEVDAMTSGPRASVRGDLVKPPYFIYGNIVDISKDEWRQLSDFMFSVEPEFVNSHFFSALTRREGYIHNLPTERRRVVVPKSPMTINDALPSTRQWWPSWDTRKQINGVTIEVAGIEQICEKLGRTMRDSRGILSEEKQTLILHQCKMSNLIWVGKDKLHPLEADQLERILGYPPNHTNLFSLDSPGRIATMKYAFQTDTVAYLLSPLKHMYPDGLRVLSIYSGIGGAEVALHRLRIPLKCVISVEESDVKRQILRRWWERTRQTGELRQLGGISKLRTNQLEDLIKEFGGFDLVIGGNYTSCTNSSAIITGRPSGPFFEYVRVVQTVRSIRGHR